MCLQSIDDYAHRGAEAGARDSSNDGNNPDDGFNEREHAPCLTPSEAEAIAAQFVQLFNLDSTGRIPTGTALPSAILSPDYTFIDEGGILCGSDPAKFECHVPDRPVFGSREDAVEAVEKSDMAAEEKMMMKENREGEQKRGFSLYSDYTSTVLHSFASCDEIAVRFESSARAAGGNKAV
ncbi:hypothetical protein Slin14017_G076310 [Septoria linicola]|nr:hypothetical protein Slin14017_G076310 [Septoria linicola]